MKYLVGFLLGLLVAGPSEPDNYHITENNRYRVNTPATVTYTPVPLEVEVIDGQEWCVIEILGGPGADWDASDVLAVLDEAWLNYNGPCDMMERREDGGVREVQGSD